MAARTSSAVAAMSRLSVSAPSGQRHAMMAYGVNEMADGDPVEPIETIVPIPKHLSESSFFYVESKIKPLQKPDLESFTHENEISKNALVAYLRVVADSHGWQFVDSWSNCPDPHDGINIWILHPDVDLSPTGAAGQEDLGSQGQVYIPVNPNHFHWSYFSLEWASLNACTRLNYHDSFGCRPNAEQIAHIKQWACRMRILNTDSCKVWHVYQPVQLDSFRSGIHCCANICSNILFREKRRPVKILTHEVARSFCFWMAVIVASRSNPTITHLPPPNDEKESAAREFMLSSYYKPRLLFTLLCDHSEERKSLTLSRVVTSVVESHCVGDCRCLCIPASLHMKVPDEIQYFFRHFYWCITHFECILSDATNATKCTGDCIWIARKGKVGSQDQNAHIFIRTKIPTPPGPGRTQIRSWPLSSLTIAQATSLDGVRDKARILMKPTAPSQLEELSAEITTGGEPLYFFLHVVNVCRKTIGNHANDLLPDTLCWYRVPDEVANQLHEPVTPVRTHSTHSSLTTETTQDDICDDDTS